MNESKPKPMSDRSFEAFFKDVMNARKQADIAHARKIERRRKSKDARAARRRGRANG